MGSQDTRIPRHTDTRIHVYMGTQDTRVHMIDGYRDIQTHVIHGYKMFTV